MESVQTYSSLGLVEQDQKQEADPIVRLKEKIELERRSTPAWFFKAIDLLLALVIFAAFLPVFLVVAAAIKLDSRGPVFFVQRRMGRGGRVFDMVKFRTMQTGSEELLGELLASNEAMRKEYERFAKLNEDPRITRIGRILRRYSMDEVPQILNVLRGEMNLVGPRPYTEQQKDAMGGYASIVLMERPGMTGLWQVSGRNKLSLEQRIQLDVKYVARKSLWMDVRILVMTVREVICGGGL